ncbi:hypothetical protein ACWOCJ_02255 [Enterococcus pseudoavium]|uniref:hypothetical protein n=1 Tax=Enterococcus pseudoavium TaxID=44007 RepID=UPI0008319886|nr:hypothetical protein [Enterococcus pseudoavium]REC33194.1 hypothetical protein CF160_12505 [Enterococcus pseudoavium]
MTQRNPKLKKIGTGLLILIVFVGSLLFDWIRDLSTNGWSVKTMFNIVIVLVFLLCSYFIEEKTGLSDKIRTLFYFFYFWILGTFASAIIYQNTLNGQMVFLYLFLAFSGSLVWLFLCKQIKK